MSDTASAKWNQHPLISTVLWILGTETSSIEKNDKNSSSNSKLNVLTWKDDHGGNIGEFMTQVQSADSAPREFEAVLSPKAVSSFQSDTPSGLDMDYQHSDFQSPQWGFYVSITPPQQEKFGNLKKDVVSIQSECRNKA
jgi:hypothetical protein